MTIRRHFELLYRLFRERKDNPLVTNYHFGYRAHARGKIYFAFRAALFILPFMLMAACMGFNSRGSGNSAFAFYTMIGALYVLFLPSMCFQIFGVKNLDRQIIDELSLTRMKPAELLFGLFYWPSLTVCFAFVPVLFCQILLLMFSNLSIDIGVWLPFSSSISIAWFICSLCSMLTYFHTHFRVRILFLLMEASLTVMVFYSCYELLNAFIRRNEHLDYSSPLYLLLPLGLLIVTLARCEALFTGAVWRAFTPPWQLPKFPMIDLRTRVRFQIRGLVGALLILVTSSMIVYFLSVHTPGIFVAGDWSNVQSRNPTYPPPTFPGEQFGSMVRGLGGWTALVFFAMVNCLIQSLLLRRLAIKLKAEKPGYFFRLPRLHFILPPLLLFSGGVYLLAQQTSMVIYDRSSYNGVSFPVQIALIAWSFLILPGFILFAIVRGRRPMRAALILFAAGACLYLIPILSYMRAWRLEPIFNYALEWPGLLFLFAWMVFLGYVLCGGLKALATRNLMEIYRQIEAQEQARLLAVDSPTTDAS